MTKDITIKKTEDGWYILWRSPIGLFRSKVYFFKKPICDELITDPDFISSCRRMVMDEYNEWREKTPNPPSYDLR